MREREFGWLNAHNKWKWKMMLHAWGEEKKEICDNTIRTVETLIERRVFLTSLEQNKHMKGQAMFYNTIVSTLPPPWDNPIKEI